jgi:hypothetical protein
MADSFQGRAYRPIDAESGGGAGAVFRALLRVAPIVCILLFLWPAALRYVAPGVPVGDPGVAAIVRFAAFAAFIVSAIAWSLVQQGLRQRGRREAWASFAMETGGTVRQVPYVPSKGSGAQGGLEVALIVASYPAMLSSGVMVGGRSTSAHYTRLAATATLARDFEFQALPDTKVNRLLMSATVWKPILAAARKRAETHPGEAVQVDALDRVGFLAGESVPTGVAELDRVCFVKATDGALARDLFADPSVRSALLALHSMERGWRVTLISPSASSPAQLEVEAPGWDASVPRLRAMRDLLQALLEQLERMRVVKRAA